MYAAGKAALLSMTRSMAAEFAPLGIRVNALGPGQRRHRHGPQQRARGPGAHGHASKMGRIASADEMVGPVLFLVSDASSYMTGQVLVVDGGLAPY